VRPTSVFFLLALAGACTTVPTADVRRANIDCPVGPLPRAPRDLPAAWDQVVPSAFEQEVAALQAGVTWTDVALTRLAEALDAQDASSVRAAVLLAYSPDPASTEVLLARLEARGDSGSRSLDAGDLVAAAALAGRGASVAARLVPLVVGPRPHPDLEVRVEIARSALAAGREQVVPFLLTVLRALTPAEREHPADWPRVETMMWAKTRAGEALAARLGEVSRVRPDGSWADQMAEADRLEARFAQQH
jgi:hypothetical protein